MIIGEELLQLELPLVDNLSDTYVRVSLTKTRVTMNHTLWMNVRQLLSLSLRNWNKNEAVIFYDGYIKERIIITIRMYCPLET